MKLCTQEDWFPPEDLISKWKSAYPKVDVEQELKKMDTWCESNPTKRKTPKGITKFCNSWLGRCQDTGGASPFASARPKLINGEMRLRDIPVDAIFTDVSWLEDPEEKAMMIEYYLKLRGHYFDGKDLRYASN